MNIQASVSMHKCTFTYSKHRFGFELMLVTRLEVFDVYPYSIYVTHDFLELLETHPLAQKINP